MRKKRIGLVAVAGIGLLVVAVSAAFNWSSCAWYGYQTERQTRFAPYVGCMVKTGTAWVPRSELRTQQ
ncbi:hypothetical protein DM813_19030 [Pseudomonas alkylphenolica]|uniref:Uncharacterized protein n=1 Tax=Pseudomonas alkylphenolica TaxID=237609 RepID=A0A443ZQC5_9PSED|nr:hypothetical protein [Pseudomonas alkylphenolica]RWU21284.1 hypothetical protein DM813_19030 [Pseudomonas alkylphenolica]